MQFLRPRRCNKLQGLTHGFYIVWARKTERCIAVARCVSRRSTLRASLALPQGASVWQNDPTLLITPILPDHFYDLLR